MGAFAPGLLWAIPPQPSRRFLLARLPPELPRAPMIFHANELGAVQRGPPNSVK